MIDFQPLPMGTERGQVAHYHRSPAPLDLNGEHLAGESDLEGLANRRDLFEEAEGYKSRFTIGFEIEKLRFKRSAVKPYTLFKGFERDGSCGVEAITNILPLVGKSVWRMKVYDLFVRAEEIIDDKYSPSNQSCGGHISLQCQGLDVYELLDELRPYMGMFYSLWAGRLGNSYCRQNLKLQPENNTKYSPVYLKPALNILEIRLPNRVTNVRSLMRRYELCYLAMHYALKDRGSEDRSVGKNLAGFYREALPIVTRMYDGDRAKALDRIATARDISKYLTGGTLKAYLIPVVDRYFNDHTRWERRAREVYRDNRHEFSSWVHSQTRQR